MWDTSFDQTSSETASNMMPKRRPGVLRLHNPGPGCPPPFNGDSCFRGTKLPHGQSSLEKSRILLLRHEGPGTEGCTARQESGSWRLGNPSMRVLAPRTHHCFAQRMGMPERSAPGDGVKGGEGGGVCGGGVGGAPGVDVPPLRGGFSPHLAPHRKRIVWGSGPHRGRQTAGRGDSGTHQCGSWCHEPITACVGVGWGGAPGVDVPPFNIN